MTPNSLYLITDVKCHTQLLFNLLKSFDRKKDIQYVKCGHAFKANDEERWTRDVRRFSLVHHSVSFANLKEVASADVSVYAICMQTDCYSQVTNALNAHVFVEFNEKYWSEKFMEAFADGWRLWCDHRVNDFKVSFGLSHHQHDANVENLPGDPTISVIFRDDSVEHDVVCTHVERFNNAKVFIVVEDQVVAENLLNVLPNTASLVSTSSQSLTTSDVYVARKEIFLVLPSLLNTKHLILLISVETYCEWTKLCLKFTKAKTITLLPPRKSEIKSYVDLDSCLKHISPRRATVDSLKDAEEAEDITHSTTAFTIKLEQNRTFLQAGEMVFASLIVFAGFKLRIAICTRDRLPHVSPFTLYDNYSDVGVEISQCFQMQLEVVEVVHQFNHLIYEEIHKTREISDSEFFFVLLDADVDHVDINGMRMLVGELQVIRDSVTSPRQGDPAKHGSFSTLSGFKPDQLKDTLFYTTHVKSDNLFHVPIDTKQDDTIVASDPFPDTTKYLTYREYFAAKYNIYIKESEVMVGVHHYIGKGDALRKKDHEKSCRRSMIHFPSLLLRKFPASFSLWRLLSFLPSVALRCKQNTNVRKIQESVYRSSHPLALFNDDTKQPSVQSDIFSVSAHCALMTSLVPSSSQDVGNDWLEFLGDSVLKLYVCVELFLTYTHACERRLNSFKNKIISNNHLGKIGRSRKIHALLFRSFFEGSSPNDNKLTADAVEAIIGAVHSTCCEETLTDVLLWFGVRLTRLKQLRNGTFHLFTNITVCSRKYSREFLQDAISYEFQLPSLYEDAVTHASQSTAYPDFFIHRFSYNFERLEFIGDAVLEILVTREIYKRNEREKRYKSKDMTVIRSSIVNTYVLAVLATKLQLHKHLLFASVEIFERLDAWCKISSDILNLFLQQGARLFNAHAVQVNSTCIEVPKELADAMESLIGAVYLDCSGDLDTVWRVFEPIFAEVIDFCFTHRPLSTLQYIHENHPHVSITSLPCLVNGQHRWKLRSRDYEIVSTARNSKLAKAFLAIKYILP